MTAAGRIFFGAFVLAFVFSCLAAPTITRFVRFLLKLGSQHRQVEGVRCMAYAGAWWNRMGLGLTGGRDEEGMVSLTLLIGPFYVGVGWA